jgi:hypothetical protein
MAKAYMALTGAGRPGSTVTGVYATVMQQQANGALTPAAELTLVGASAYSGVIEDLDFSQEYEGEDVGLLCVEHADETSGAKRTTVTLTEILKYKTGDGLTVAVANGNLLQQIFNNGVVHNDGDSPGARIAQFRLRRANRQFLLWVRMKTYNEMWRKGICRGVLTGSVLDPGAFAWAHPYISIY